jgi:hypothetical protein
MLAQMLFARALNKTSGPKTQQQLQRKVPSSRIASIDTPEIPLHHPIRKIKVPAAKVM